MQTIQEMRSTRQGLLNAIEDVNRQLGQSEKREDKAYLWCFLAVAVAAVILLCATGGLSILPLAAVAGFVFRRFGVDPEKPNEEKKRLKVRREKLQDGLYELEEKLHAKEKEERERNQRKD